MKTIPYSTEGIARSQFFCYPKSFCDFEWPYNSKDQRIRDANIGCYTEYIDKIDVNFGSLFVYK